MQLIVLLYFGVNVHIGANKETRLIYSAETTAAFIHDSTLGSDLLYGKEKVVYGAAGYKGIEKRPEMKGIGIGHLISMTSVKR
jgi:IS5 family transposase